MLNTEQKMNIGIFLLCVPKPWLCYSFHGTKGNPACRVEAHMGKWHPIGIKGGKGMDRSFALY